MAPFRKLRAPAGKIGQSQACLGKPGHEHPKVSHSTSSFHGCLPACKKSKWDINSFKRYNRWKNPAIWLAESIFAQNSRTRFFLDLWFEAKKSTHQWTRFLSNLQKVHSWAIFRPFCPNEIFREKSGSVTFERLWTHNYIPQGFP